MQRILQDIQVHVRSLWPDGVLGFHGKILVVGWEWGAGNREEMLQGWPLWKDTMVSLDRASFCWLWKRPTTGQSWDNGQHLLHLRDNIFNKGWKMPCSSCKREQNCERNNSANIKVSKERVGAPGPKAEVPLQPIERTMAMITESQNF